MNITYQKKNKRLFEEYEWKSYAFIFILMLDIFFDPKSKNHRILI